MHMRKHMSVCICRDLCPYTYMWKHMSVCICGDLCPYAYAETCLYAYAESYVFMHTRRSMSLCIRGQLCPYPSCPYAYAESYVQRFTETLRSQRTCSEKLTASRSVLLHPPPLSCQPLHQIEVRTCGSTYNVAFTPSKVCAEKQSFKHPIRPPP